jgi:hypothetical protein
LIRGELGGSLILRYFTAFVIFALWASFVILVSLQQYGFVIFFGKFLSS